MSKNIIGVAVIAVIYFCIFIVLFSPSLYTAWLYLVSRYTKVRRAGLLRLALTTFSINMIVVVFLYHLAFNHFLAYKVAEKDAAAAHAIENAIVSQENFFTAHGRYYPVGPVRGPYRDDHGLTVEKDVILQVEPHWDKVSHKETFKAYAVHVLGKDIAVSDGDRKVQKSPADSNKSAAIRSKLLNSVK
ncbi:MAG: hypothetical protein HY912_18055 [Desulfomonile tiedjei]|uniref:Uncharacterized protein n=1 Tax=Desulfomonile tiedjei TaxID=2358 RepID=A0A9D6V6A9_9BACT|nr:hypothetical protein [Desulfomonile tiedjei]